MASSSNSVVIPPSLECDICFNPFESQGQFIPVTAGHASCVHAFCKGCFKGMDRCPLGDGVVFTGKKPVKNFVLNAALDIIQAQNKEISRLTSAMTDGGKACPDEIQEIQTFFVNKVENLHEELSAANEQNNLLQKKLEELEARLSAQPPVACSSIDYQSTALATITRQPQVPCCSTDILSQEELSHRVAQLIAEPTVACSSTDRQVAAPAAPTVEPYTRQMVVNLFRVDDIAKSTQRLRAMDMDVLYETIYAGNMNNERILSWLSDDQLRGLRLSRLTSDQVQLLFPETSNVYFRSMYEEKMAHINPDETRQAIIDGKFNMPYLFKYLSLNQARRLALNELTAPQVRMLFETGPSSGVKCDRSHLMSQFSVADVNAAIQNNKMNDERVLCLLSDDQLRGLRLSQLTTVQVQMLFPETSNAYYKSTYEKNMAFINASEIRLAIIYGRLNRPYLFKYLSLLQVQHLTLNVLTANQVRWLFETGPSSGVKCDCRHLMSHFSVADVNEAIQDNKMNDQRILCLLSDIQLQGLSLSLLTREQVQMLFPETSHTYYKGICEEKMKLIPVAELRRAFRANLLNGYLAGYLPATFTP